MNTIVPIVSPAAINDPTPTAVTSKNKASIAIRQITVK